MSGKTDFSIRVFVDALLEKGRAFVLKNRRTVFVVTLVAFLYVLVVVTFKVSLQAPKPVPAPEQHSQLHLLEFINAYRDYQRDFDVEKVLFGEKFLSFTLNVKFRTSSVVVIKKLATDMALGLAAEYPELDLITIDVIQDLDNGSKSIYGHAVYSKDDVTVVWRYQ
jgi:hypothetical protein